MIIMEEEEEQIFFWRRNLRLLEVVVFFPLFFLAFLNWATCTCMEEEGERRRMKSCWVGEIGLPLA